MPVTIDSTKNLYGTDGFLTVNAVDVGATEDDFEVSMDTTEFYPDLHQALMPLAGSGKIIGADGELTVKITQFVYTLLSTLFSMGASSDANSEKIGSGLLGTVTEIDNVILTGLSRNDGKAVRVTMAKARVSSPFKLTLSKKKNASLALTFKPLALATAPSRFPMWIEFAK